MTTFRTATESDLEAVEGLLKESNLPTDGVSGCIGNFIVAESHQGIVGSVGIERYGDYALLRSAAVSPDERGHGVGRRLVEAVIAAAEQQGVTAMYLLTTTAENYFPSFGFRRIMREDVPDELNASEELRGACPASAVVMQKNLRTS